MTAEDILRLTPPEPSAPVTPSVDPGSPLADVLALILDSPSGHINVASTGESIDMGKALSAASLMIPRRPESSQVTVTCHPSQYSASKLARAVEDTDTHLLDLYTIPATAGNISAVMRVSRIDPSPVIHSLRRYGFTVTASQSFSHSDRDLALSRIEELRHYLEL